MGALLAARTPHATLPGRVLGLIFEKSSTRTRVSFEAGMAHLGGSSIFLSPNDTQLGRGEPVEDTARVVSRMVDLLAVRTYDQTKLERFATHSAVPVINALTDLYHPCQILADVFTYEEHRGSIQGRTVAFVGDGYNMCHSYINAARQWGFELRIATPEGYEPDATLLQSTNNATLVESPREAVENADLVVTDVWSSMGHEEEQARRCEAFAPYQVNEQLLDFASDSTLFMHCLPAHRGEEVNETVLDDPRSVVWEEAGNRLHSQKALMEFLLA